jgi:hypothetical protein
MARMPHGILGGLIGTIGPVTGSIRFGVPVLRSKPRKTAYKLTPKRKAQQLKMKVVLPFIKAFTGTEFFKKSFPRYGGTKTGYNLAVSYNMNMALTGTYPDIELSYPLVLISRGHLPKALNASVIADEEGNLEFSWEDNSDIGKAKASDKVLLVAYCPEKEEVIFSTVAGQRDQCRATLRTTKWKGENIETWIGFINEEETDASDSVYTGSWVL